MSPTAKSPSSTGLGRFPCHRFVAWPLINQPEAEQFASEDHRRREAAEVRNNADQLTYQVDKALVEYGDKVPQADRDAVAKANDEVNEALKGDDTDKIRSATESLMQATGPSVSFVSEQNAMRG